MNLLKNIRLSTKISMGYGLVLLLMVVIAGVIYFGVTSIVNASRWVNHTYEVIRTAESVGAAMIDMETGQRGFMVTGQDEYLEPYHAGKQRILELLKKGRTLTSDNAEQGPRWDKVRELQSKWLSETAEVEIETRRQVEKGFESNANFDRISARTVGKQIFDDIRSILKNLDDQFTLSNRPQGNQLITLVTLDLVNMETGQRGFLLTGKEESLEPWVAGQRSLDNHLKQLNQVISGTRVSSSDIQNLKTRVQNWVDQAAQPEIDARREVNQHPLTMTDIKKMMQEGKGKFYMDTIRGLLKEIVDAEEVLIEVRFDDQQSSSNFVIATAIIGTLIAILFSAAIAAVIVRGISGPIALINRRLEEVAQGDLTQRIDIDTQDELGQLSRYLNAFVAQLQNTIQEIVHSSSELTSSASQVKSATSDSAQKLGQQADETVLVATSVNQMTQAIEEVARSTELANSSASQANDRTVEGNALVQETLKAIQALTNDVDSSSKVLGDLKSHSENIGTVLDVIKNIAEQTNLLALNAAIEAARAGEQGRGFAVVADEVRTLAKRTQDSTSEIETIITDLQAGSEKAVSVMEQSRSKSFETLEKAEKTGEFLSSINDAISKVLDMNTQISTAAQQQAAVTQDVNRSVANIETISKSTVNSAHTTQKIGEGVAQLSGDLQQLVRKFKV